MLLGSLSKTRWGEWKLSNSEKKIKGEGWDTQAETRSEREPLRSSQSSGFMVAPAEAGAGGWMCVHVRACACMWVFVGDGCV